MRPELAISIKEARKIMGKEASKLSDDQLADLIMALDLIASFELGLIPKA